MRGLFFIVIVFFFSSCYSDYKTIAGSKTTDGSTDGRADSGKISTHLEVGAISIFPIIPRHYWCGFRVKNNEDQRVCLSHVSLTLKRPSGRDEHVLKPLAVDSIQLEPGQEYTFSCTFAKHSRLFPHTVTMSMTGFRVEGNKPIKIEQSQRFVRFMYVNLAGI
jgi:hypothetical protein